MKVHAQDSARVVFATGALVALIMAQGCASKEWVTQQMDPLSARVAKNESRLTLAENQIGSLGGRVTGVEGKFGGFEGKLGTVDAKSEKALNAIANLRLERRVVIELKDGAKFGFDSANLPAQTRKQIDVALGELKSDPGALEGATIVVAGHTDSAGAPDYNYELGQRRANAVARYLTVQKPTDRVQVIPVSYGESAPLLENSSSQGRAKNRRVEILVYREAIVSPIATSADQTPPRASEQTTEKVSQTHR
ncbi:MAG: OmpA family protein [Burkholderiales bacterium]